MTRKKYVDDGSDYYGEFEWQWPDEARKTLRKLRGTWVDQRHSSYSLEIGGSGEALDVSTTRPNGKAQVTRELIHVDCKDDWARVVWGKGGPRSQYTIFSLTSSKLVWQREGSKPFEWTRSWEDEDDYEVEPETGSTPHYSEDSSWAKSEWTDWKVKAKKEKKKSASYRDALVQDDEDGGSDAGRQLLASLKGPAYITYDEASPSKPREEERECEEKGPVLQPEAKVAAAELDDELKSSAAKLLAMIKPGDDDAAEGHNSNEADNGGHEVNEEETSAPCSPGPADPVEPAPATPDGSECGDSQIATPEVTTPQQQQQQQQQHGTARQNAVPKQQQHQAWAVPNYLPGVQFANHQMAMYFPAQFQGGQQIGPIDPTTVVQQVEYWFSDESLKNDHRTRSLMNKDGWIALIVIHQCFSQLQQWGVDLWAMKQAIANSSTALELDATGFFIRIRDEKRRSYWNSVSLPWVP